MSAVQPHDILLYAGADAWTRFGTFTRRTARIARLGESQLEAFSRTDATPCARFQGFDGLVHVAQANVIRPHWVDTNGDGIPDTLTYRAEPPATNRLLQSQALGTTWAATADTPTNNTTDTNAPDGTQTATKLVPSAAVSLHYQSQAVAITANEFLAASIWVKAGASYNGFVLVVSDGTVTNGFKMGINLSTGAVVLAAVAFGTGTLSGSAVENWGNGWFRILLWGAIGNAVASASVFTEVFDTAAHASTQATYAGDTVNGIYAWGAQLERNGVTNIQPPTAYIATAAATVTRTGDTCTVPVAADATGPLSIYAKFIERGAVAIGGGVPRVFEISKFGANPRFLLYATVGKYNMALVTAGASQFGSGAALAPTYGQLVELCGSYDAVGTITLTQAINGVAGAPVVSAAAPPGAAAWGQGIAGIFQAGDPGTACVAPGDVGRIVLAQGVHTLAEMQAIP